MNKQSGVRAQFVATADVIAMLLTGVGFGGLLLCGAIFATAGLAAAIFEHPVQHLPVLNVPVRVFYHLLAAGACVRLLSEVMRPRKGSAAKWEH